MVAPLADPDDVRLEIDTTLEDPRIDAVLQRVARDNDRVNDAASMADGLRTDLEAAMAAYHIATQLDRAAHQKSLGSASKSYEVKTTDRLRERIEQLDPSNGAVIDHQDNWTVTRRDVTERDA